MHSGGKEITSMMKNDHGWLLILYKELSEVYIQIYISSIYPEIQMIPHEDI